MNCFQILYLWQTENSRFSSVFWTGSVVNCFQILYLWQTENSKVWFPACGTDVVNCFQILYLWQTENSTDGIACATCWLWIAFKFFIFDKLKTAVSSNLDKEYCCELLSNSLSLTNWKQPRINRLRKCISCELLSNSLSLTNWKQPKHGVLCRVIRCELLSNSLSLTNWKQSIMVNIEPSAVVNCFQILYLWQTENSTGGK